MSILSVNTNEGQGVYEARGETGKILTRVFTFEGERILTPAFGADFVLRARAARYAPPDPYAAGIATLRAASATPERTAEDAYKDARMRVAMAMRARLAAAEPEPRLTAAELSDYAPPDPYQKGLDKMRSEGR